MNKEIKTYKTDHPIIKEISIGDKFICNNGTIVTFVKCYKSETKYPLTFIDLYNDRLTYTFRLKFSLTDKNHPLNIKQRFISLKDKIDLL